ncbi:MAG: response regulator [Caldilineaceae bacterium]
MQYKLENNHRRIAIVSGEEETRQILSNHLRLDTYQIFHAEDGGELLKNMEAIQPDLVLMDVMTPNVDGYETCRKIRANPRWQHLPIILMTALNNRAEIVKIMQAGADEFLSKPVQGPELRARVQTILRIKEQFDQLKSTIDQRADVLEMLIHDIRNSLAVVTLKNQHIRRRQHLDATDMAAVRVVEQQLADLNLHLNDVLMVTQIEKGRFQPQITNVNVELALQQSILDAVDATHIAPERLQILCHEPDLTAPFDVHLLQRLLSILLTNAIWASTPESTIRIEAGTVSCWTDGNEKRAVQICLHFPELMLPASDQQQIFQFATVERLRAQFGAQFGVGFAFCDLIMDTFGGRIFAQESRFSGTVICLEFQHTGLHPRNELLKQDARQFSK